VISPTAYEGLRRAISEILAGARPEAGPAKYTIPRDGITTGRA
jgi:hypothetical protein